MVGVGVTRVLREGVSEPVEVGLWEGEGEDVEEKEGAAVAVSSALAVAAPWLGEAVLRACREGEGSKGDGVGSAGECVA